MWRLWGSPASFGLGYEPQPLQILWTSVASYLGFPLPRFIPHFLLGEQIDISLKIKKKFLSELTLCAVEVSGAGRGLRSPVGRAYGAGRHLQSAVPSGPVSLQPPLGGDIRLPLSLP